MRQPNKQPWHTHTGSLLSPCLKYDLVKFVRLIFDNHEYVSDNFRNLVNFIIYIEEKIYNYRLLQLIQTFPQIFSRIFTDQKMPTRRRANAMDYDPQIGIFEVLKINPFIGFYKLQFPKKGTFGNFLVPIAPFTT